MPYRVPACALRIIGTRTMQLPRKIVSTACHQLIPSSIRDEASMYVGMHADMLIHSTAISRAAHLRRARGIGAMSRLKYSDDDTSSCSSTISADGFVMKDLYRRPAHRRGTLICANL